MNMIEALNRLTIMRALAFGIALAILYRGIFYDSGAQQLQAIESTNQRIQTIQADIQSDQKKLDRAAVYKRTAAENGGTILRLLSLIPENLKMSDLMRIVSNEVKVAGSSLMNIAPGTSETSGIAPEFQEFSVLLEVKGNFLQHMILLSNLTKINQILVVRSFEFNHEKDGRGEEPPVVGMKAEIVAFRYQGTVKKEENTQ